MLIVRERHDYTEYASRDLRGFWGDRLAGSGVQQFQCFFLNLLLLSIDSAGLGIEDWKGIPSRYTYWGICLHIVP